MFCGHCGQPNPDANTICTSCGKDIRIALNPAPPPPVAVAAAPDRPLFSNLEKYDAGLVGVGGWLLFFWLGTTILTPIVLLREVLSNGSTREVIVLDLAMMALALATGIALWIRSRYALGLVRSYFIAQLAFAALNIFGSLATDTTGLDPALAKAARAGLVEGARTLLVVSLWWAYFKKSVRVLSTYGRNL